MKLSRKKTEVEERLNALLDLSEALIAEKGFENFKLEDLTIPSGFSRGTIYLTFKTKEVLVAKLAISALNKWLEMIKRAMEHRGGTREKLLAIYISHIILMNLSPSGYASIQFVELNSNRPKIPTELLETLDQKINMAISHMTALVDEAIEKKDLTLPKYITSAELATNLWTANYGAMIFSTSHTKDVQANSNHPQKFTRLLLDQLPWLPVSKPSESEEDMLVIVFAKVFPNEFNIIYP